MIISLTCAKRFLIEHFRLSETPDAEPGLILDTIEHLGSIQYDPLNVVGRNPDLVLQARFNNYSSTYLNNLLYSNRQLLDGWDKMMSIYPSKYWPYFDRIRQAHGIGTKNTLQYRNQLEALDLCDDIMSLINIEGPKKSGDLQGNSTKKGRWGHGKLSSAALDYLYAVGQLVVYDKQNAIKTYELSHKVIPKETYHLDDPFSQDEDFIKWYIVRRVHMLGLLWNKSGSGGWLGYYLQKKTERTPYIKELLKDEILKEIFIEGIKHPFLITSKNYKELLELQEHILNNSTIQDKQVKFIAPLDNLMWDREMIEKVFGFEYRWEVYTPVKKRKYGYYVLPILYGCDLVGRIEFDYYRGEESLNIKNVWYEETFTPDETFTKQFNIALNKFLIYLKASYKG